MRAGEGRSQLHSRKPIIAMLVVGLAVVLTLSFVPYSLLLNAKRQVAAVIMPSGQPDLSAVGQPAAPPAPAFDVAAWYAAREEEPERHGVLVETLDGSRVLASHNPDTTFNPASLIKLSTSLVSLRRFGADHRFETRVYAEGERDEKGVLKGRIYVAGADPVFGDAAGALIARELRARGITDATEGVFVSPDFCFNFSESPEESAERLVKVFAFKKAEAAMAKAAKQTKAELEKVVKEWRAADRARKQAARERDRQSAGGADKKAPEEKDGQTTKNRTAAKGGTPANNQPAAQDEAETQEEAESSAFPEVKREGPFVAQTPPEGKPLFVLRSYPLRDILLYMNAHSSNFVAERLGAMVGGPAGVQQFLVDELKLPAEQVTIERTSGREHNRMTARGLLAVIRALHAEAERQGMRLEDIMPVATDDVGTLRRRLAGTPLEGAIVGKTGTLTHEVDGGMASLAGVVYTQNGGTIVFAILDQGSRISESRELEDQLLNQVIISQDTPITLKHEERRRIFDSSSLEISSQ